jgi:sigma-B regulation protein RsbU (phosphoserine phosphatase)
MNSKQIPNHSDDRLKAQFKGIPIPTFVWQYVADNFVLIDFNNAADTFTHGLIQQYLGATPEKTYKNYHKIKSNFIKCISEKATVRDETADAFLGSKGTKSCIMTYVYVPPDLVMVHHEDITEQKITLENLKKLSNVVEQTADSVIVANRQGIIEYVNPAFELTTGYKRKEAIGKRPNILQSGLHDKKFYNNIWVRISQGKSFRGTIINKKKNGELYWSEQTITPLKDEKGEITHYVSVLKDITDLKKKQEQALQLNIARKVQQNFYKDIFPMPGFDIAGAAYPAVETGGDYYDFISMPDGCFWIVVGDVSGHGIGSALVMTTTRAYLRAFVRTETEPHLILTRLNQELTFDFNGNYYVTLFLCRINPPKRELVFASAGHESAFLLNPSGDIKSTCKSTGIPLGFMSEYHYGPANSVEFNAQDIVVFLTDGVTEAIDADENPFGTGRALEYVHQYRDYPARQIVQGLYQQVREFSMQKPQEDDITSVICKVNF